MKLGRTIVAAGQGTARRHKKTQEAHWRMPVLVSADGAGEAQPAFQPPPGSHQEARPGLRPDAAGAAAGACRCSALRRLEPGGQMKRTTSDHTGTEVL